MVHRRTHTGEKPFPCHQCPKAFKHSPHLVLHRRNQSGENPFPCDQCHKAFKTSSELVVHRRSHTGEKPFPCDQCTKAFKQSSELIVHRITPPPPNFLNILKLIKTFFKLRNFHPNYFSKIWKWFKTTFMN